MTNFYVVKKTSHKEGKEPYTYLVLVADLGFTKQIITMDRNTISNLLDVSAGALYDKCKVENKEYLVGTFTKEVSK